jgi:hypothetical protein
LDGVELDAAGVADGNEAARDEAAEAMLGRATTESQLAGGQVQDIALRQPGVTADELVQVAQWLLPK